MFQKIKKAVAIMLILILLPYIITIFAHGKVVEKAEKESGKDELLKEYCISLLAQEISSDYEEEMLKVQALLVRTTVYQEVEELGEKFFEQEQFVNKDEIDASLKRKLQKVWEETEGEVLMYEDKLALVPFHQVSNGKTRNGKEVLESDEYPYLQVRECPKDVEAERQMESKFIDAKNVTVEKYDSVGYALQVKVGEETCS